MIDILAMAVAALGLVGCATFFDCVEGTGEPTTQERELESFKGITIQGSMDVVIQQGPTQSVKVVAQENLLPLITTTVADNRLTIGSKECYTTNKGVRFYVTVPDIQALRIEGSGSFMGERTITGESLVLEISGSGDIRLDVGVGNLRTAIDGSGDVQLKGRAASHAIEINGSGDINGVDLATERCSVEINGSGDCIVNVATSLDVEINGVGDVKYKGAVQDIRQDVNGIGDVERVE